MNAEQTWTSPIGRAHGLPEATEVRDGCVTPARFGAARWRVSPRPPDVAVSDASYYGKFRVSGPEAMTLLNRVNMIDISRIPIQKMGVSLMLEDDGRVLADTYVFNRGPDYLFLTEGQTPAAIAAQLPPRPPRSAARRLPILQSNRALIDLSGPYAWELLKDLAGVRVVGLRYLEAYENQKIDGIPVTILRAGKTGEFGYLLLVEAAHAGSIVGAVVERGRSVPRRRRAARR